MVVATKKRLGGSLESIFDDSPGIIEKQDQSTKLAMVMVQKIVPGEFQPRSDFDHPQLEALANSIKENGVLQPILVREKGDGYEIIAGERRWRATRLAGLQEIPVIISKLSDKAVVAAGLVENIQREDLNPIEEAIALKRLLGEFEMTHEEVANSIGRSRASVTNQLRLLNLTNEIQKHLIEKKLEVGHGKILAGLDEKEQGEVSDIIISRQLSVRDTERFLKLRREGQAANKSPKAFHPKSNEWSAKLSQFLSSKATVTLTEGGKGKVVIEVNSPDEVEWLISKLG